jgi:hypothetical protein
MGTLSSKMPASDRLQMVKGVVMHYPLPLPQTMTELNSAALNILVNGVPTKNRIIWQSLVNTEKVKRALVWLKCNNDHYKDIDVDNWLNTIWAEMEDGPPTLEETVECEAYLTKCLHRDVHLTQNKNAEHQQKDDNIETSDAEKQGPMIRKVEDKDRYNMEHFTIHPTYQKRPKEDDMELYEMVRIEGQKNIDNREPTNDVKSYPKLYPYGRGGKGETRPQPISPHDFIASRLFNKDARFRRNPAYIFDLLWDYECRSMAAGMFQSLHSSKSNDGMSVGNFLEKVKGKDHVLEAQLSTFFEQMRGTPEYWSKRHQELNTMVRELGPFTFFLTLSPAEYDWPDMEAVQRAVNKDVPGIENMRRGELCASDPVTTSKHFHHRFWAFFNNVICCKEEGGGPLGVVNDYFVRVEYQARGMPHYHCVLWIDGAPRLGIDDNKTVADFVNARITCRKPDPEKEPLLADKVNKYQMHKCNSGCLRTGRSVNGRWVPKQCRFGYPRPERDEIQFNNVMKTNAKRSRGNAKARLYELPRTQFERTINDYNPLILLLWGGNVDVQYVGESTSAVARYIVGYVTKAEKTQLQDFWEQVDKNQTLAKQLAGLFFRKMTMRECGIAEACDKLSGQDLYRKSRDTKYINARLPSRRRRMLKPFTELQKLDQNSTDKYANNWIDTYYPNRPESMEYMCLYDFIRKYDKVNDVSNKKMKFINKIAGGVKEKNKPFLISHTIFRDEKQKEEYCYSLLFMFKPFRDEVKELMDENKSCESIFNVELETNVRLREHHEKLQAQFADRQVQDELREQVEKDVDEENRKAAEERLANNEPTDEDIYGRPVAVDAMDDLETMMNKMPESETEF